MASVDPLFAQWLQAEADWSVRLDVAAIARWGTTALTTERLTGLATKAAAEAEGDRQLAFFARGPFAIDVHQVLGLDWGAERGRVVTLSIDELGYDAGVDVFVLEVEPDPSIGLTTLGVIRPLKSLL